MSELGLSMEHRNGGNACVNKQSGVWNRRTVHTAAPTEIDSDGKRLEDGKAPTATKVATVLTTEWRWISQSEPVRRCADCTKFGLL